MIRNVKYLLVILFWICVAPLTSQTLKSILNSKADIKTKCSQLESLMQKYTGTNMDSAIYIASVEDSLASISNDYELKSNAKCTHAIILVTRCDEALKVAYENLTVANLSGDCKLIANAYLLLARINWFARNDVKVFQYFEEAVKRAERCGDKQVLIKIYNSGEDLYFNTQQFQKNKEILFKLKKLDPSLENDPDVNADLGDVYRVMDDLDSAEYYYMSALRVLEAGHDTFGLMMHYGNYSLIPKAKGDYKKAILYCEKALALAESTRDIKSIISANKHLYEAYRDMGDLRNARKYLLVVIQKNEERNCEPCLLGEYKRLSELDAQLKNYESAYRNLLKNNELYQKINTTESQSNVVKIEEDNIKKQKQLEIDLVNQQKEAEKRTKNLFLISLCISGLLIAVIIVFLQKVRKSEKLITLQKGQVEKQKHLIEEKHKEITDSINYAERIQRSFLASESLLQENLKDHFVLFQPKDVVSGDFYWATVLKNGAFVYATADSTGHGVPGAIMSILNISSLEKAVEHESGPASILNATRAHITERLKKDGSPEGGKDGMDCSLVVLDKSRKRLTYSAANNPVWIVRNSAVIELAPDKMPVGKHDKDDLSFTEHSIHLQEGDLVYTFTDGLPDQFGGPKGKKFMYKQFKELLVAISVLSVDEQKIKLMEAFNAWKGGLEQVDDVCVIGVRI